MNLEKDFNLFAKSKGISSSTLLRVNNSALPYVLEERRLNVQALDIYSRLLYDRIIYMGEEFTPESCNLIVTQLLYLNIQYFVQVLGFLNPYHSYQMLLYKFLVCKKYQLQYFY